MADLSVSSMRDCQPAPAALKCLMTSRESRRDTSFFVGARCGPRWPRRRRSSARPVCAMALPQNAFTAARLVRSYGTSAALEALLVDFLFMSLGLPAGNDVSPGIVAIGPYEHYDFVA